MRKSQMGLTIVEVLLSIVIFGIIVAIFAPLFLGSTGTNKQSRVRTQALAAAEIWMDRYRQQLEPLDATGSVCTESGTTVTCNYPYNNNFASDGVASHATDASTLSTQLGPYRHMIKLTQLQTGTSSELWQIETTVYWKQAGKEYNVALTSQFAK
ncbi:type IV pilus modification PilV family protein [Deinococcus cellulosilyticus]|uniref:Uncharacterized protein n=1 Tax=Deinococcus cellulosilyticus (strain DSM 18568 / NBRC 106333 / KACC 11606 / 5516J-15) TaxID=1223518 RepID=A0A511N2B9_DEIC1|nr:type II secretion system protein [Deinococcus cellulosilyticus]GEM47000.1 hypothetical protein DC3_26350 [Deinococcus cellulosilyticus NBRC 106333 = KACC 11606]